MACRLDGASHYLNQCWDIVNWTLRNKLQWNFNRYSDIFSQENAFENVVCEMASILSRPQCVNDGTWSDEKVIFLRGSLNSHLVAGCPNLISGMPETHERCPNLTNKLSYSCRGIKGNFPVWYHLKIAYIQKELSCFVDTIPNDFRMHYMHRIGHALWVNILRPRQNGRHLPDDILKWILLDENVWILIDISLKFGPRGPINNIPTLVQVMARRRPGDKPLSEPMMVRLLTHICVTRPQWVNINEGESRVCAQLPKQMSDIACI